MKDPFWGRLARLGHELGVIEQLVGGLGRIRVQARPALFERTKRLLQGLRERATDGHHLSHRLHASSEAIDAPGKLLERPTRDLCHHVVDRGLETREGGTRDVVGNLVERVTHGQARRDLGDRKAGRLRRQRGRARNARVHLDHETATVCRVNRELDVGPTRLDSDAPDASERVVPHGLELDVGKSLCRSNCDRIARVNPHGVEVLDRAHHDAVVHAVAHHLELELLPAGDRALDQDSRHGAGSEPLRRNPGKGVAVVRGAGPRPPQDEAGTHHQWEPHRLAHGHRLRERGSEP